MRSAKGNLTRYPQLIVKRVFDIVASTIVLVLFSPLLLLASLAIKLNPKDQYSLSSMCIAITISMSAYSGFEPVVMVM